MENKLQVERERERKEEGERGDPRRRACFYLLCCAYFYPLSDRLKGLGCTIPFYPLFSTELLLFDIPQRNTACSARHFPFRGFSLFVAASAGCFRSSSFPRLLPPLPLIFSSASSLPFRSYPLISNHPESMSVFYRKVTSNVSCTRHLVECSFFFFFFLRTKISWRYFSSLRNEKMYIREAKRKVRKLMLLLQTHASK